MKKNARIEIESSIVESMKEVQAIREGKLPKRSHKEMINRIRVALEKESEHDESSLRKYKSKAPRLKVENGMVKIDLNDPLQKKWFEEFEK